MVRAGSTSKGGRDRVHAAPSSLRVISNVHSITEHPLDDNSIRTCSDSLSHRSSVILKFLISVGMVIGRKNTTSSLDNLSHGSCSLVISTSESNVTPSRGMAIIAVMIFLGLSFLGLDTVIKIIESNPCEVLVRVMACGGSAISISEPPEQRGGHTADVTGSGGECFLCGVIAGYDVGEFVY